MLITMLNLSTTINTLDELRAAWTKVTPEQVEALDSAGLLNKIIAGEARIQFRGSLAEGTAEGQVLFDARTDTESGFEAVAAKPKRVLRVSPALVSEFLYKLMMENIDIIIEEYGGIPPFNIPSENPETGGEEENSPGDGEGAPDQQQQTEG